MLKKLSQKIFRKLAIPLCAFKAAVLYKQSFVKTLSCMIYLYRDRRFLAEEAYKAGMLNLKVPKEVSRQIISQRFLSRVHRAVNPHCWQQLSHNKGMFYRHCQMANLPIPQLYAIFFKSQPGYRPSMPFLNNKEQWLEYIRHDLPNDFAVKQLIGFRGRGFNLFEKKNDSIIDARGGIYSYNQFYEYLAHEMPGDSIIQARVRNHPYIAELNNSPYLQTMRIITLVNEDNTTKILFAYQKLILGDNIIDNSIGGTTGNIEVVIDLTTGTLEDINTLSEWGLKKQHSHPITGKVLQGYALPYWCETVELAKKAAIAFLPIRTIGWDMAITAEGPMIIEGNIWWNYANALLQMGRVSNEIFSAAGKHQGPES